MSSRTEARREAILDAAKGLFLEKGFQQTSLCDILRRSKGSRSTLYKLFGNKEGLLEAMIQESTDEAWGILQTWLTDHPAASEQALVDLGCRFMKTLLAPGALAVHRVLVSEAPRVPEQAAFFFEAGPERTKARLTAWFAEAQDVGDFVDGEPALLAELFLGMVFGDTFFRRVLGLSVELDQAAIEQKVRTAVAVFLEGVRRR